MARLNRKLDPIYTHEGAPAKHINPLLQLRRAVMACLLWEDSFYESGVSIAKRIADLVKKVDKSQVCIAAIDAREKMNLRHVPLLLLRELARERHYSFHKTLTRVIQRPDEITEFLAIYWKDGKCPLSAQVKKGLGEAFNKFNEYSLAKYNRDGAVKLRDALFLSHAKPKDKEQEALFKKLVDNKLEIPDTWEVGLSTGGDKKETFTRLINERKLGDLALLRNLRNMQQAKVDKNLIKDALLVMNTSRVLPFRFITAARHAVDFEPELEQAMFKCVAEKQKLPGRTVIAVDVSGSMVGVPVSRRSEVDRLDAACGVAILARELCDDVDVYSFSTQTKKVPARRGFALRDAIKNSQDNWGTYLGECVQHINKNVGVNDRFIVITDEQSHDRVPDPMCKKAYVINVAAYRNGVGYGKWIHIDGFSEAILDYIREIEKENVQ